MMGSKMISTSSLHSFNDQSANAFEWTVNRLPLGFDCFDYDTVRLLSFTLLRLRFVLIILHLPI